MLAHLEIDRNKREIQICVNKRWGGCCRRVNNRLHLLLARECLRLSTLTQKSRLCCNSDFVQFVRSSWVRWHSAMAGLSRPPISSSAALKPPALGATDCHTDMCVQCCDPTVLKYNWHHHCWRGPVWQSAWHGWGAPLSKDHFGQSASTTSGRGGVGGGYYLRRWNQMHGAAQRQYTKWVFQLRPIARRNKQSQLTRANKPNPSWSTERNWWKLHSVIVGSNTHSLIKRIRKKSNHLHFAPIVIPGKKIKCKSSWKKILITFKYTFLLALRFQMVIVCNDNFIHLLFRSWIGAGSFVRVSSRLVSTENSQSEISRRDLPAAGSTI